jgi:hypothetical protein
MEEQTFEPGDEVELKSGSSKMLVTSCDDYWIKVAFWNETHLCFQTLDISTDLLKLADEDKK